MADGKGQGESSTKRLGFKKQTLDDAYAVPANLLEIEICNPETHGLARNRYTDYEVKMKVSFMRDIIVVVYRILERTITLNMYRYNV